MLLDIKTYLTLKNKMLINNKGYYILASVSPHFNALRMSLICIASSMHRIGDKCYKIQKIMFQDIGSEMVFYEVSPIEGDSPLKY